MKLMGCLISIMLGTSIIADAQIKLSWSLLSDVEFESKYFEKYDAAYLAPTFGEGPRAYEGKEVLISGFFIPLNEDEFFFVLSRYPYSACYFCGAAGPESIVELQLKLKKMRRFKLDEQLTFKGILRLNASDVEHLNYILEDAEPYE